MSQPHPTAVEAPSRRASSLTTYFVLRVAIAVLLTGADVLVFLKSSLEGLRNSTGTPVLHWLLIAGLVIVVLTLLDVWSKTLRHRRPSKPNSSNPFL
jgi:hypothetical protein